MRRFFRLGSLILATTLGVAFFGQGAVASEPALTYRHFHVTDRDDRVAEIEPIAADPLPLWARDVSQEPHDWSNGPPMDQPYFQPPIVFVIPPPEDAGEPFYSHNHQPDIAWLPNGDLMAIWYTTRREQGTELTVLASRLRAGSNQWEPASEFFKAADRNMHGNSLFHDGRGTLHHMNGMGREGATGWEHLALLHRTSRDNGVTWSVARPVSSGANYQRRHQVIAGMKQTADGALIQPCDATPAGQGPTALHISDDGGETWTDPGGDIRGIHAGVVELKDGRLLALGRGQAIDGRMPISISEDRGKTWTYQASEFPPIGSGQRLVLMRLHEGPLLLVSFTGERNDTTGLEFVDARGESFRGVGMFAALSLDEGKTWPVRKLLTPGKGEYDGGAWTGAFTASPTRAEHGGYLAATQTPDGMIHLISSRLHYRFNLAWLQQPNPGPAADSSAARHLRVFSAEGRFGGWPANGGMWIWGNEILVCYTQADHKDVRGHTYDRPTARNMLARSLDGGETWTIEDAYAQGITAEAHDHRVGERAKTPEKLTAAIDFTHPDFAFLLQRENNHNGPSHFYYTYDRGKSWSGAFPFPDLDTHGFAARTDYLVGGRHEMLVFLTAAKSDGREGRIAVTRTEDGGVTWQRIAWIGPEPAAERDFAIMPSSVRLSPQRLLTVIRHRQSGATRLTSYRSDDNAETWQPLSDPVSDNVNSPPALLQLPDGRLVLAYVFRRGSGQGSSVCVRISRDEGQSWSDEIVLRGDEGANTDVGYPRIVRRPDGHLVIVYYWNHALKPDLPRYRYIAATIWQPEERTQP